MNWLDLEIAAPELFILVMGCVILMLDLVVSERRRGIIHMVSLLTLAFATIITLRGVGGVTTDTSIVVFGNTFVRDPMADLLKVFSYATLAAVFFYARHYLREFGLFRSEFYALCLFALLGVMVLISAASMVTLYLGLELLSLSSYALVAMDRSSGRGSEAAMKYFVLGSMASGLLLYGMSMIYGATGSLELAVISAAVPGNHPLLLSIGMAFVVAAIAFKLGAVPFHMWVPDVYQGAPAAVTLFIGSVPKLAAFALLIRLLEGGLSELHGSWQSMLVMLSVLSIGLGNLVAIVQQNIKRMLAYSTISHMGFVLMGVLSGEIQGYAAGMFYVIVYALMAAGAFGVIILLSARGVEAEHLEDFRGLNQRSPWFAGVMAMFMFSMAGIPPFVGFFAKLQVIQAVIHSGLIWLAVFAVVFSVIGAYYYLRVVKLMYFDDAETEKVISVPMDFRAALSVNGLLQIGLGFFAGSLISACLASFGAG